ncbi:MAG: DUF3261 domain-containing protein [Halioglobus sp.]|nr:DUF3261 domain-containing protein [Halioglobus sp.]
MMKLSLAALLFLWLGACANLRDAPLDANAVVDLGAATELSGALLYQRTDGSLGHYLLALRVDGTALDLAVVTPQAVPLYRVQAVGTAREVVHKLAGQGEPGADELLRALRLMYGRAEDLAGLLQAGWTMDETAEGRNFYRGDSTPALEVEYEGKAPWYREVRLKDRSAGTILSVRWLDY